MATTTLRPNSTLTTNGEVVAPVGAASLHAATADDSDSTYANVQGIDAYMRLGLTDASLPADAVVRGLAARVRYQTTTSAFIVPVDLIVRSNITGLAGTVPPPTPTTATVTAATLQQSVSDTELDGAYLEIATGTHPGATVGVYAPRNNIYEVYLDVIHVAPPTVDVTGPTGTLTEANRPYAQWTAGLDPDGGPQTQYQVKVFVTAQYEAEGFDPATATPLLHSGVKVGTASSFQFTEPVVNDTYRTYVRIAQTVNNTPLWSAYDHSEYTIDVDAPATPTITAEPNDDRAGVEIELTANTGDATTDQFELERSDDDGITWQPVRAATITNPTPTIHDYEAPNGGQVTYRARALHDYSGSLVASAWAQVTTDSWFSTAWWLKHPGQPDLNMPVLVRSFPQITRAGRVGIFQPLGATDAIAISDTRGPVTGTITLRLDTLEEQAALDALLDTADTLLLTSPDGEGAPGYIRIGDHTRQRITDRAPADRTFDALQFTTVQPPLVTAPITVIPPTLPVSYVPPSDTTWTTLQLCTPLGTELLPWMVTNRETDDENTHAYYYFDVATGGTLTIELNGGGEMRVYNAAGTVIQETSTDYSYTATAQRHYIRIWGNFADESGTIRLVLGTAVLL